MGGSERSILEKIYPDGLPADVQEQVDKLTDSTGAAGDDMETNSMNPIDNEEIQVFVDGVEEDLQTTGDEVTESNVWKLAKKQVGEDKTFLDLVKAEIRSRKYK